MYNSFGVKVGSYGRIVSRFLCDSWSTVACAAELEVSFEYAFKLVWSWIRFVADVRTIVSVLPYTVKGICCCFCVGSSFSSASICCVCSRAKYFRTTSGTYFIFCAVICTAVWSMVFFMSGCCMLVFVKVLRFLRRCSLNPSSDVSFGACSAFGAAAFCLWLALACRTLLRLLWVTMYIPYRALNRSFPLRVLQKSHLS